MSIMKRQHSSSARLFASVKRLPFSISPTNALSFGLARNKRTDRSVDHETRTTKVLVSFLTGKEVGFIEFYGNIK